MEVTGALLKSHVEKGILILTVTRSSIEGDEVAQALREQILAEVERTQANRVVIDLQHARYVSSIAFWPLLSLRRHLLGAGGRLMICGLTHDVQDIFTTTRMISTDGSPDAPFEVAADQAAAVARLTATPSAR
jgi:anti-anti-sigma factor